jgi:hypothetical protein
MIFESCFPIKSLIIMTELRVMAIKHVKRKPRMTPGPLNVRTDYSLEHITPFV